MSKTLFRKVIATTLIGSLTLSVLCNVHTTCNTNNVKVKAAEKTVISVDPTNRSTFHDTNHNSYGEFQGFGTSLCWWANRVGYSNTLSEQATDAFYDKEKGLGMTIGRYNIGGGDDPSHDHITRSDSKIPGYAVNPTKITTKEEGEQFDQYDLTAGYAWNYDWNADKNQLNVLMKAAKKAGENFLGEAFSNSPPYFMTNSGCSSGGVNSAENLRSDCHVAFAKYLTDVTKHLKEEGYSLSSLEPMNEPSGGWTALNSKQEGCKIEPDSISALLPVVKNAMLTNGLNDMVLAGCDYSSTTDTNAFFSKIDSTSQSMLDRMDIHCYTYNKSSAAYTRQAAQDLGVNLWMSEVDGSYSEGTNAQEMSAALGLSKNMTGQLNYLMPSAWVLWDAIDIHVDANNKYDADSKSAEEYKDLDKNGFWGIAVADHNQEKIVLTKKYYGMGQYSRYIKPGYTLLGSTSLSSKKLYSTAAFDATSGDTVIVVTNLNGEAQNTEIDLSAIDFSTVDTQKYTGSFAQSTMEVIRTSGDLANGENWADVTSETTDSSTTVSTWNPSAGKISTTLKANSITTYVIHCKKVEKAPVIDTPAPSTTPSADIPAVSAKPTTSADTPAVSAKPTTAPSAKAVKNPCKKIKSAKKNITIKKGSSKALTFPVTNTVTSKKTTDKVTVTSSKKKIVTIKKTTNAAKKISVKVKARKKGKAIITVKAGKKHAKTIVKVK